MPVPFPRVGAVRQTHTFRDAKGMTSVVGYWLFAPAGVFDNNGIAAAALAIKNAIVALTNSAYQGSSGPFDEGGAKQYGSAAAAYASVMQEAKLRFQDADGGLHTFHIPAPKLSVFDTDNITVLPSAIATLRGLLVSTTVPATTPVASTVTGVQWTNFMGGFFAARGRKANKLLILDGALTPSEPGD